MADAPPPNETPAASRCPRCGITVLRSSDNATGHCNGCAAARPAPSRTSIPRSHRVEGTNFVD